MCGILGWIKQGRGDERIFQRAIDLIRHRGPDDGGIECFRDTKWETRLGHRRLSILDLSPLGHQPMSDDSGRYWIVFNGEIYNFKEVRKDLEARGYRFRSSCDTEILLYAYRHWGPSCLERLNGMFAFGIWDKTERTLFLARDRLGEKPLYYAPLPDGGIAFSSEVKSLLQLPGIKRELATEHLARYLAFLWVPDPDTLFRGIYKLKPGHWLKWKDGQIQTQEWWDIPLETQEPLRTDNYRKKIVSLLRSSIMQRMVSDVPIGTFLSGGIDSSAILGLMRSEMNNNSIITYTVGFRSQDLKLDIIPDDIRHSRVVAAQNQPLDYNEIVLDPGGFDIWPKLIWHLDEPIADPAAISTYLICREARKKATVMLSGIGGEELFAGYPRHLAVKLALQYRKLPLRARRSLARHFASQTVSSPTRMYAPMRNLKKFLRSADQSFEDSYLGFLSYYSPDELTQLLGGPVVRENLYGVHLDYLRRASKLSPLNRICYLDMKTFLPFLNLAYADKASMASSVEVRVPLLDHRFVELACSIPDGLKVHGWNQKHIFKESMRPYVPKSIVRRKKAGFSGPVRAWIRNDYREPIHDLINNHLLKRGFLDPKTVKTIWDDNLSGREDFGLRIWALVTLELWMQTFIDRPGDAPLS
ncbi:MAG: asparagine synthase (glutamine-hydrolyzing) [Verrucomicrobiae bacterium]|nr:asparagine synthase (glutamine-hydrolyzing) [Verrucomicrobiae bacterium]